MLLDGWKDSAKRVGPIVVPIQHVKSAYLTALGAGLVMFAAVYVVSAYLAHIHLPNAATLLDDFILGFLAAVCLVLSLQLHNRRELSRQAEKIAMMQRMNHHVRNALQVISYVALQTTDHDMQSKLTQAIQRIERALREDLPEEEHQSPKERNLEIIPRPDPG